LGLQGHAMLTRRLSRPHVPSSASVKKSLPMRAEILASTMVDFDPRFEITPGTKAREPEAIGYVESGILGKVDPYEAVPCQTIAEWPFVDDSSANSGMSA
jgi:hypothetical protein